ncbi:hypothetical protein GUITHDRAFT_121368 [Guillardia theta CCMP2712]|uniref:Uncharacterized protein n=1 Tax=Guillardia theta (strain CCMP2712) TaxID=905079 RepID=L1I8Q4_GUITC|nr:hypothetical protein GUITHDRAFT_121368 [Guillardia theta CCMP2712]EKX32472.1 hypothetical protein GUITHDRAFT_121368 [Guillardia theta CCMP2712]|eukprot:XP_005819452.1 hypothetical protein GUITHDRAFT_121368 [Guillardia theta CCMP2712]
MGRKEEWEDLDVKADERVTMSLATLMMMDVLALATGPVYLLSAIFEVNVMDNLPVFASVGVLSVLVLALACQNRLKKLRDRLIKSRGIELESTARLKQKGEMDERTKNKLKASKRECRWALSLALSSTNSLFLIVFMGLAFFILRSSSPVINYAASSAGSCAIVFYMSTRAK